MRTHHLAMAIGLLAASASQSIASAQGWLADRQRTEGPGIRLGDFELHPGIGVELGWDSNLYYTADNPAPGLPGRVDTAILRVTPHLLVSTRGLERRTEGEQPGSDTPPEVQFRGGVSASYYEFFADESRRNVSVDVGLNLNVLQGRPVSFVVNNQFSRSIRPFTDNTSARASTARIQEIPSAVVTFSTPGQVFQVSVGYQFALDFFEAQEFSYANSFTNEVTLFESFRFLPQTALVHRTTFTHRDYYQPPPPTNTFNSLLLDSAQVSSSLAVNGAITNEISFTLGGGYAAGFFDPRNGYEQEYDSIILQAALRWRPIEQLQLAVGYDRGFHPSFVGNYYSQDRGYLRGQLLIDGVFLVGADFSVAYYDFGVARTARGLPGDMLGSTDERQDVRLTTSLFAEYRFTEWLGVNGTIAYSGVFTDFQYVIPVGMMTTVLDPAQYNKVEMWLGVRVFY